MTDGEPVWRATISVHVRDADIAGWMERALAPEASREVPRAHAELRRAGPNDFEVVIQARDTGAVRAALNTYLGWVHLALATLPPAEVA